MVSTVTVDDKPRGGLAPITPERRSWVARIGGIRRIGIAALGLQLVGFLVWSVLLASRYSVNQDFATYHQALYLIGRGDFNPFITGRGITVWHDHGQFILIPLAILFDLWPHTVTILWMADLSVVGAELIAFLWMCDVVELEPRPFPGGPGRRFPLFGVALLVLNPLMWWGVAFDVHTESFAVFFLTFAAYDFFHDRRRAWIWVRAHRTLWGHRLDVSGGIGPDPPARRVAPMAESGRRRRHRFRKCLPLVRPPLQPGLDPEHLCRTDPRQPRLQGKPLGTADLPQAGRHPTGQGGLSVVWQRRPAFFANLAPPGVIGLATRWTFAIPVIILLENGLQGRTGARFLSVNFAFQSFGVYVFVALGAVMICTSLAASHARWLRGITGAVMFVLLVNVVGWAVVWAGTTPGSWIRVSSASAAVLSGVNAQIGPDDEVIVSQGVVGAFAGRRSVYPIVNADPGVFPINERRVWIIILPNAGIETAKVNNSQAAIGVAATLPGARLVASAAGSRPFGGTHRRAPRRSICTRAPMRRFRGGPSPARLVGW